MSEEKKLNGTVIVTYRCNARCSMCNRYKAPSKPEEEISIETIKKLPKMKEYEIAKELSAQGIPTPFTRRCQLGYMRNTSRVKAPAWQPAFVTKVLENPVYDYEQIAMILTQKKRSTLRGRQEWNGMMVANIMKNERRWGDLEARKSIVVDYKLGKVTKNNGNRCSAYVPEHHEAIVSPEIARAAHLVASSKKKCGVQDIVVIQQGALKGFVGIHPNWSGINAESIRSLCLNAYLPEEVVELNDMTEMRSEAEKNAVIISLEKDEREW